MKLSVVIVNYNVKYFLRQCLASVYGSERRLADGSDLELEVWVVDNDSVDDSVAMVKRDFPQTHLVENHDNVGFARANNQCLACATGETLLLLNPDTVVEPDTLVRCVDFMTAHPGCGGLAVKMIDGKGNYLRESKRGFPSPAASLYKMAGLARLFPRSRRFAAYYMGHLGDDQTCEIDILPGAFLMFRREVYDKIGGLDESYFMYGEDIDFSWRIRLAGWKNYYLPETHIIHYKGESTKKGSMNYVYTFYNAMAIFVGKYFTGGNARLFHLLLKVGIWLRAAMAWLRRIVSRLAVPLLDFGLAYGGFVLLKGLWEQVKGVGSDYYPPEYTFLVVPLYILILMAASWLHGGYDRPVRTGRIVRGMATGLLLLLAFYSLLDESQRYSRMLLLLGSFWTLAATLLVRLVLSLCKIKGYALRTHTRGTTLIVGSADETRRIQRLVFSDQCSVISVATQDGGSQLNTQHSTLNTKLQDLIRIEHADEVVFCGKDLPLPQIIELMAQLKTTGVEYKIAPSEADYVIGSDGVLSTDQLYVADLDTIGTDTARRTKRLFDILTSLLLLLGSPLLFWFQRRKRQYFGDCLKVLVGSLTWVGYTGRRGLFTPADILSGDISDQMRQRLMLRYMRHYRMASDWKILLRNWNKI